MTGVITEATKGGLFSTEPLTGGKGHAFSALTSIARIASATLASAAIVSTFQPRTIRTAVFEDARAGLTGFSIGTGTTLTTAAIISAGDPFTRRLAVVLDTETSVAGKSFATFSALSATPIVSAHFPPALRCTLRNRAFPLVADFSFRAAIVATCDLFTLRRGRVRRLVGNCHLAGSILASGTGFTVIRAGA